MTKAERKLAIQVAEDHYVKVTKSKVKAADTLIDMGLLRAYEDDNGDLWVKARTYETLQELRKISE